MAISGARPQDLVDAIAKQVADHLHADFVFVMQLMPSGRHLRHRACVASDGTDWCGQIIPLEPEMQAAHTLQSDEPVIALDQSRETRFRITPRLRAKGVTTSVTVAIRGPRAPYGVLAAHFRTRHAFTDDELGYLRMAAEILGQAAHRKQAEKKLLENEALLKATIDNIAEGVVFRDLSGLVTLANPAAEGILGRSTSELKSLASLELVSSLASAEGGTLELHEVPWLKVLMTGQPVQGAELTVKRLDGERVVLINCRPVHDQDGLMLGVVSSITDITEQRQAELELRESRERLAAVIDNSPIVFAVLNLDGIITFCDGGGLRLMDSTPDRVVGLSILTQFKDEPLFRDRVIRALQGEQVSFIRHIKRTNRYLQVLYTPTHDEQGKLSEIICVATDVTEQMRADEELRRSLEELKRVDGQRRKLLHRVVTAQEEERRRIAADLHDDSVQMLSAMAMRVAALRGRLPDKDMQQSIAQLETLLAGSTERLRRLIFDLRPLALEYDGLHVGLRSALEQLRSETGIEYRLDSDLTGEPNEEVRTIVYRIIQEALTNVRKHSNARKVTIKLQDKDGGVYARVHDDGVGFPVAHATAAGHLGLAAMRERAELAGGWWRLSTGERKGATIEFLVPGARGSS
jgi:PAS domain S-box-containing protein